MLWSAPRRSGEIVVSTIVTLDNRRILKDAAESLTRGEVLLRHSAGSSRQRGGCALERKPSRFPDLIWFLSLLICTLAVALAFVYLDVPIAHRVHGLLGSAESLGKGLASAVLLSIEAAVALALVCIRIMRGHLSRFGEATALACLTSICAYAVNDSTLFSGYRILRPCCAEPNMRSIS